MVLVAALGVVPVPVAAAAEVRAAAAAIGADPVHAADGYVGAKACAECHDGAYRAWAGSQHRHAMQVADASTVLGNFRDARFTYAGTTSTFSVRDGRYYVRTDGPDGKLADFEIRYTFGVYPLQQYLIELPGGRLQALGIAWDARPKGQGGQRWFHLYPGQKIKAGDPLHWTGVDQRWNYMCAECHSTDLRKNFDPQTGRYATTWAEINVACEACHGPGREHVAWARAKKEGKDAPHAGNGLVVALDERSGVSWLPTPETGNAQRSAPRRTSREIDVCARCHARAGRLTDRYVPGKPPLDTRRLARLDEGLYWPDGQMRDEVYNWGSFVQSRMYAQGVTCADCHDPHSLALRRSGNEVCAGCHAPVKYDAVAHTHHRPGTPGASCAACHMPTTTYMVVDPRHDHSMRIPRPDVSAKLGMPNACNNCHGSKTAQWAADAIARWTGKPPASFQNFAQALRAGDVGAPGARGALLALVEDRSQPSIVRASAIDRLARWLTPSLVGPLSNGLNDADPLVRLAAVDALAGTDAPTRVRYLARMTADPVLAVRIAAAQALAGEPEARLPAAERPAFARALDEYIAAQLQNADRPEGRMSLATLYANRGDPGRAQDELAKALALDPTSVGARVNLADLERARGDEAAADAVLREGIARTPDAAPLHYALGLSLVRQKRGDDALRQLAMAAKLAPANARFAYVYAVALHDAGRGKQALKTLSDALAKHPYDRDILVALVQYAAAAGDRAAARRYARTLTELDPDNRAFARLAASLADPAR